MSTESGIQASAPAWLRQLGFSSWLLVGFVLILVGVIWLLDQTSTIVMPVILAAVLGAVAGPAVSALQKRGVPRIGGAILVLLGLVAAGALVFLHGLRRDLGQLGRHLGEAQPGAGQDPGLAHRPRRGQRAERHE